jgi:hypothetical protein
MEVRAGLVPASVFKTDDALREQRHGGFDSHALPFVSVALDQDQTSAATSDCAFRPWILLPHVSRAVPCGSTERHRALPSKQRVDCPANLFDASTVSRAHRRECLPQALLLFVRGDQPAGHEALPFHVKTRELAIDRCLTTRGKRCVRKFFEQT